MNKLLVVVDYQVDFVTGALGFEAAKALEDNICAKIEAYRAGGQDVVFTLDTHEGGYLATEEGKNLPVAHCIRGGEGWALYGRTAGLLKDAPQFEKPTFPSLELAEYLKGRDYGEVELVGIVSNICVLSNAVMVKAALPNAHIVVDAACTASYDTDLHEKALDVLGGLHIEVRNR